MTRTLSALLILVLLPAAIDAQQVPQTRQGFGISFGVGGGSNGLECNGCTSDRESGASGYLRVGGYVRPDLMVAGETNGWAKNVNGVDETANFLSAVVQWYPNVETGLYLKGGAGFASSRADDGVDEFESTGLGINLGIGYDWRLTRGFSLTPYVNYLRSVGAEEHVNGVGTGDRLNVNVLQFGLGFSWH